MGAKVSGLIHALYDPKKKQFLGRDGGGWGKLGTFYFFFYLGLAGFFCAMLAVFMALSPRDRPRYFSDSSRMRTRSNPLSPGLGFRPQPEVDKNLIVIKKGADADEINPYAKSLDQYLQVYYWKKDAPPKQSGDGDAPVSYGEDQATPTKFYIQNPGGCRNDTQYGYKVGRPCVLVKMNKVVGFVPEPGYKSSEKEAYEKVCKDQKGIALHCQGEYPADIDNLGNLNYFSENGYHPTCGSLNPIHFPYKGKRDREDIYQAPYVWVQLNNPKPNVLINVICRIFGKNIDFDKKTGRALTRFQVFVEDQSKKARSDL